MPTFTDPANGQTITVDFDPNEEGINFHPQWAGHIVNSGWDGALPGAARSRYFTDLDAWHAFKNSGESIDEHFAGDGSESFQKSGDGRQWAGLNNDERELIIFRAGQRIQRTYDGKNAAEFPLEGGKARYEAENRLGKAHESLY